MNLTGARQHQIPNVDFFSNYLDSLEKQKKYTTDEIFEEEIRRWKWVTQHQENKSYLFFITHLKFLSFNYRFNLLQKESVVDKELKQQAQAALSKWKEGNYLYLDKSLTARDQKKIHHLLQYPPFLTTLLENKRVMDEIFKLVFRDNFPIKPLLEYFKTVTVDLKNALMTMRIGFFHRYKKKMIQIKLTETENGAEKDLLVKINGTFVSILNGVKKISLNGNQLMSWSQIMETFELAKKHPSQMEFFEKGLLSFMPQGIKHPTGRQFLPLDTSKEKFWDDLPSFLTISKEEVESFLNIKIEEDKTCVATIESSCLDPHYVKDAHGASMIYLQNEDGSYQVFPFGKYPKTFPQTECENSYFIGNTLEGEFTYPDPTPFYTQRIHGVATHLISKKQAFELMETFAKKIKIFQFAGNNCSADFQMIFEEKFGKEEIPNYFRQPLLDSSFFFPANIIFGATGLLPPPLSNFFLHGIHLLFGSKREYSYEDYQGVKQTVSLYKSEFCETQELYVPGLLVEKILKGEIKGVTWYGYN